MQCLNMQELLQYPRTATSSIPTLMQVKSHYENVPVDEKFELSVAMQGEIVNIIVPLRSSSSPSPSRREALLSPPAAACFHHNY